MPKKNFNNTHKNKKLILIFCFIFSIPLFAFTYIYAESVINNQEVDDLTIYDSNSGFYEVPMSVNTVSHNEKSVEYPTMAITDTLILKDSSSGSLGLSVYKLSNGSAILHAEVGGGNESTYDIKPFGVGDFTMIKTAYPYSCSELTLFQCKTSSEYLEEKLFSVTIDGVAIVNPAKPQIQSTSTATSTLMADLDNTAAEDGVLFIASTTNPTAPKNDPITVILDNINPAESTLVLPASDSIPEVNLDSLLEQTSSIDEFPVIQSDYSNNEEVKNADF